jgi:hypothetical protein
MAAAVGFFLFPSLAVFSFFFPLDGGRILEPSPESVVVDCAGHSIGSSIAGSSETGSMEEDGGSGSGSREPFVAGSGSNRGVGAGTSAGGGAKLPQVLQKSFGEVQGILEHNRVLIQEISQNQETRDADGLTRNVALIRELNTNIARVVDLYGDMSGSFARAVAAKKAAGGDKGGPKRPRSAGAGGQQQ